MQNPVWKLTALAGVIGIGFLVVLQAQQGLSRSEGQAENQKAPESELGEGDSTAPPSLDALPTGSTSETVPSEGSPSRKESPGAPSGSAVALNKPGTSGTAPDGNADLPSNEPTGSVSSFDPGGSGVAGREFPQEASGAEVIAPFDGGSGLNRPEQPGEQAPPQREPPDETAAGDDPLADGPFASAGDGSPEPAEALDFGSGSRSSPSTESSSDDPGAGLPAGSRPPRSAEEADEAGSSSKTSEPDEPSGGAEPAPSETQTVPPQRAPSEDLFGSDAPKEDSPSSPARPVAPAGAEAPADEAEEQEDAPAGRPGDQLDEFNPFADPPSEGADAESEPPAEPEASAKNTSAESGQSAEESGETPSTTADPAVPARPSEPAPDAFHVPSDDVSSDKAEEGPSEALPAEAPDESAPPADARAEGEAPRPSPTKDPPLDSADGPSGSETSGAAEGPPAEETSEIPPVELLAAPDEMSGDADPAGPESPPRVAQAAPETRPPQTGASAGDETNSSPAGAAPSASTAQAEQPDRLSVPDEPPSSAEETEEDSAPPQQLNLPSEATALETAASGDVQGDGVVDGTAARGPQQPRLTVEKRAPKYAVLGRPMTYSVVVQNVGGCPAAQIVVEDRIPKGSKLVSTEPRAEVDRTRLVWKIDSLQPDEKRELAVRVVPTAEGEIGSVATVSFSTAVAAETRITAPEIRLDLTGPEEARLGEPIRFRFEIRNDGTSPARGVMLRDLIPEELHHPQGDDLEYEIGTLSAGESREVTLTLTADKEGRAVNRAVLTADGDLQVEAEEAVEITAQSLEISRSGPEATYVGRTAALTNSVTNSGEKPLSGITVVETVPAGMEFVGASAGGSYHEDKRTVSWRIAELGARESVDLQVTLRPTEPGTHRSVVKAVGPQGHEVETSAETQARGFAAVGLEIPAIEGPLGVGETTTVRVIANNRGTSPANDVQIDVALPKETELVSVDAPVEHTVRNGMLRFEPVRSLEGGDRSEFRITLKAKRSGDVRLRAEVRAEQMKRPLSQEEALLVLPASR